MPGLVAKYKEKVRITQLKKIYSELQTAFSIAVYEHGPFKNWDLTITNTGVQDEDGNLIIDNSGGAK